MIIRMVAVTLVGVASLGLSRLASYPYHLRVRSLEEWQRFLSHLVPLIGWRQVPLAQAMQNASQGQRLLEQDITEMAQTLASHDMDFATAFESMLCNLPGLWEEDVMVLRDLGRVLGASDTVYQEEHVLAVLRELQRLTQDARERRAKDGRVFPVLVGAFGAAVVILML